MDDKGEGMEELNIFCADMADVGTQALANSRRERNMHRISDGLDG